MFPPGTLLSTEDGEIKKVVVWLSVPYLPSMDSLVETKRIKHGTKTSITYSMPEPVLLCFHVKYLLSMLILGVRFIVRKSRDLERVHIWLNLMGLLLL